MGIVYISLSPTYVCTRTYTHQEGDLGCATLERDTNEIPVVDMT